MTTHAHWESTPTLSITAFSRTTLSIMKNIVMLGVTEKPFMLSVIMLSIIWLNVVMLNVIILNVVALLEQHEFSFTVQNATEKVYSESSSYNFPSFIMTILLQFLSRRIRQHCYLLQCFSSWYSFLVKRVPGWGPEQRESEKTVLYPQIIILLMNYINIYYYMLVLNYQFRRTIPAKTRNGTPFILFTFSELPSIGSY